jgi:DNA-directed RNA polymerase sigma subunit (sigma70/sigma32)
VRSWSELAESAGNRLIEARLSLVVSIAEGHAGVGIPVLDLIQKGNEGLLVALKTSPELLAIASRLIQPPASRRPS